MKYVSKNLSLVLILILAGSSVVIFESASAQVSKPSVPEFSLRYVDHSYDVPPTYGVDQFTGKTVITSPGEHIANKTVEVTIKNQKFTGSNSGFNGSDYTGLLYTFRAKGHFGDSWSYYPFHAPYPSSDSSVVYATNLYGEYTGGPPSAHIYPSSDSAYTVVTLSFVWLFYDEPYNGDIPSNSQIDFQVQALIGTAKVAYTGLIAGDFYEFRGEQSDWSNTATITIADGSSSNSSTTYSTSPNPTSSPTITTMPTNSVASPNPAVPEFSWLVILPLFIAMLFIAVKLRRQKRQGKAVKKQAYDT